MQVMQGASRSRICQKCTTVVARANYLVADRVTKLAIVVIFLPNMETVTYCTVFVNKHRICKNNIVSVVHRIRVTWVDQYCCISLVSFYFILFKSRA